jgi:hypothetical protein
VPREPHAPRRVSSDEVSIAVWPHDHRISLSSSAAPPRC